MSTVIAGKTFTARDSFTLTDTDGSARCPVGGGVAYAVQNRLKKAAAFHIVDAEEEA